METILIIVGIVVVYFLYQGYKNKKSKEVPQSVKTVVEILSGQIAMFSYGQDLPDKARDPYSLGYIAGLVDASVSGSGIDDAEFGLGALGYVYQEIFGRQEGRELFSEALDYIENQNSEFNDGLSDGGSEFIQFMSGQKESPLGWIGYVKGYTDDYKNG